MKQSASSTPRIVYFGGEPLGVPALEALEAAGIVPTLVVASPDRPVGRTQALTPPPTKAWAETRTLPVFQPPNLKDPAALAPLTAAPWDLFVVVAYNHLLPAWLLEVPAHGVLNLHPSLLPAFRGPSPIRSAILADARTTGVSVMLMDALMDHGPLLAQETLTIPHHEWPLPGLALDARLAAQGGALLAATIPRWLAGELTPQEQDHAAATYTTKLTREDGRLTLDPHALPTGDAAYQALRTIRALDGWPETFFEYQGRRIKIKAAHLAEDGALVLDTVVPEGKRPMPFADFLRSLT